MKLNSYEPYGYFFETLASPTRLSVVKLLQKKPLNVTQLYKALQLEQSTVSHSLKRLQQCHFVHGRRKGKEVIYNLNIKTIVPLMKLIDRHVSKVCVHCIGGRK